MTAVALETDLPSSAPDAAATPPRSGKLGKGFKVAYGAGQVVDSLSTILLNTFLFFYVTNVCGLSGSLAGLAMFLALAFDAVADPVIGSISDNLRSRFGRRVPVMAVSLVPIALSLGLLFSVPRIESGVLLFGYVLTLLVVLRVSMSGFNIPYLGLGAELSADYDERSSVVAFRSIFGMVGTLAAFVLGFGVFLSGPKGLLDRDGYGPLGWTAGSLLLLAGALATWASWRNAPRAPEMTPTGHALGRRLFEELRDTFRNRSFRLLFGGVLVFFVGYGIATTLGLNGNKYYWGLEVAQIQTIALAMVGGMALGLPLAFVLIGRVEKRSVVVFGIAMMCLAQGLPPLLGVLGLVPEGLAVRMAMLVGAGATIGTMITLVAVSFQSAMADAVDEHELLFGGRREGLYFASLSFASKAALGLGSLVSGIALDLIRFPSAEIAGTEGSVSIAPEVLRNLGLAVGPGAALVIGASVLFFWRYRLDRAAHAEIVRKLGR